MNSVRSRGGRGRCGWFDAAAAQALDIQINGISGLCVTKLDVLDGVRGAANWVWATSSTASGWTCCRPARKAFGRMRSRSTKRIPGWSGSNRRLDAVRAVAGGSAPTT